MAEADHRFDCLLLDHQLCFPLYACSKEIIRRYMCYVEEEPESIPQGNVSAKGGMQQTPMNEVYIKVRQSLRTED